MKILVADDSSIVRRTLKQLLARIDGIDIILESHSVYSTINEIEVELPDLIILDLQMADGKGTEVLSFLQQKKRKPLTIILTNYADENNRKTCMNRGADYFFDKSNEYSDVLKIVEYYIDGKSVNNSPI